MAGIAREFETVVVSELDDGIALVRMNRPERLNALDATLVGDLYSAMDALDAERTLRAVVLTGAGRGFCAGLDLNGYGEPPEGEGWGYVGHQMKLQQHIAGLIPRMRALQKPIIAAVNGPAAGGGLAIACGADVRIAARSARFNCAFVRIGYSGCDIGVSWMLPRLVGATRAFELMLTGRIIDADEADRIGLVVRVVPDGEVVDAALETARLIRQNSPFGIWMTKEVMWANLEVASLQAGIDLENRTQILTGHTADTREAFTAFREKRAPEYRWE